MHAFRRGPSARGRRPARGLFVLLGMLLVLWVPAELGAGNERPAAPQAAVERPAESGRYEFREDHDPNGIGKFYMGREIAQVMGFAGVKWLERPEREEEERLTLLVESLGLKSGVVVADIGAGSGVIALQMAEKVRPGGKVVAVDIQKEMLDRLQTKIEQRRIDNVQLVLGTTTSPRLEADSIDLAVLVDVYHEFSHPYEMLLALSRAIKPGGRIAFVEYRREDPEVRRIIKLVHTMSEAQLKKEMSWPEFGLRWTETLDPLPRQHIILFERLKPKASSPDAERRP